MGVVMRDRHFMEDENEFPFLVNSKRDYETGYGSPQYFSKECNYENIPFNQFSNYVARLNLSQSDKVRIFNSIEVKPKNVTVSINQSENNIRITFHVKNQYFKTDISILYDEDYSCFYGNYDSYSTFFFESEDWFKKEVRRKEKELGNKFLYCGGIYTVKHDEYNFVLTDEWIADARFDDGNHGELLYDIDFENKVITDKCFALPYYVFL